jgi:hypothetical protein
MPGHVIPKRYISQVLFWLLLLAACSKKDQTLSPPSSAADFLSFGFQSQNDTANINPYNHFIILHTPYSLSSGTELAPQFSLSPGATATVNQVSQISGATKNNFEQDLIYTVTAADQKTTQSWTVQATNNDFSLDWGLGHFISSANTLDRNYEWYIDQGSSGTFSYFNCGPASVTMAIKWSDSAFTHTAQEARETYETGGGWWYTNDIDNYLTKYNTPHVIIPLSADAKETRQLLIDQLSHQQIVILCIDMNYVRSSGDPDYRVDKFYPTTPAWGHFFVVKGYQQIDGEVFFQIYDPYSIGLKYADNTFKGRNRFYRYEDVAAATSSWWNYAIIVAKKGETVNENAVHHAVKPSDIQHAHGY